MEKHHLFIGLAVAAVAAGTGVVGYVQGWIAPPELSVEIHARWPDGSPLAGASVQAAGSPQGETDADGKLVALLHAGIGEEVGVEVSLDQPGLRFEPWQGSFVVRKWDRDDPDSLRYTLAAELEPREVSAIVQVTGADGPLSGAPVAVGGKGHGKTGDDGTLLVELGEKRARKTTVAVKMPGYEPWSQTVTLAGGETTTVDLEKLGTVYGRMTAAYEKLGRVVRVPGAEVTLGGRRLGTTDGMGRLKFPVPGRATALQVHKDGYLPNPAERKVTGGVAVLPLFPKDAPSYRLAVLPPKNGSPGQSDVAAVLPEIEDKLADYLSSYGCFEVVDSRAFTTAMRKAGRSEESLLAKGWAGTKLADMADAVVASELALDEDLVLSLEVVSVRGKRLGAFAETQRLSRARRLSEDAAEKVRQIFPFEGYVTLMGNSEVTTNLGSAGERDIRRGAKVAVYRWNGSDPAKSELLGRGKVTAVRADDSRITLDSGNASKLRLGDKVVLLPRAEDAAYTAAIELTVKAGTEGSELPLADVNVYRDGTWVGTTSESGRLRAPVAPDTRYRFLFVKSGIKPHSEEITSSRSTASKTVRMPSTMSLLSIESQPSGATVTVDGRELGVTPLSVPVLMGFRRVVIDAGGDWRPFDQVLELTAAEESYTGPNRIQLESDVLRQAERLLSGGALDDAIALLEDVQPDHPDFSAAHNLLGGMYLDQRKDPEAAIAEFETVLARPENRELVNKRFTVTFLNLGRAYYAQGTPEAYEKAIANLEIARDNKRFFPRDRHDLASHDTLYFLALASHKLYHAERSERLLRETQKRWKDYFDFFPQSLAGDPDVQQAREGAEQYYDEIKAELRE